MPEDAPVRCAACYFILPLTCYGQVSQRMLYGTGANNLREVFGHDNFGTDKVFTAPVRLRFTRWVSRSLNCVLTYNTSLGGVFLGSL